MQVLVPPVFKETSAMYPAHLPVYYIEEFFLKLTNFIHDRTFLA